MLPPDPPYWGPGTKAERLVFETLRASLPDEVTVAHGTRFLDVRQGAEGEADFLILWPGRGLLLVECKGHGVRRCKERSWVRVDDDGEHPLGESPFEQAETCIRKLVSLLEPRLRRLFPALEGRFPFPYGYAVILPFARFDDRELPLEAPREIAWDASDLARLRERVEVALDLYGTRAGRRVLLADRRDVKRFLDAALLPRLDIVPTLGARLEAERNAFVQLTAEQRAVVDGLQDNQRLFVQGGAGTGKTVLALHVARRHAEAGRDVLLVCFTDWLATEIQARVAEMEVGPGSIRAVRFHALCLEAYERLGRPDPTPAVDAPPDVIGRFWNEQAPETLFDAITSGLMAHWDAIVVDEGQDFVKEWWDVLECLFRDEDQGQLAVFYDPRQDIFGRSSAVPCKTGARFTLPHAMRNTKAIARVVADLGASPVPPHPDCPEGDPVEVKAQEPGERARGQIANLVRDLVGKEGLDPATLAILTPHSRRNSFLAGQTVLGGVPLADHPGDRAGKLLHTTIGKYKGLEADVVILADVDRADPRSDAKALYVAASRARQRLFVFEKRE
jgi:hypothetical protein